jgi:ubiquinone biosynthesis protein
MSRPAAFARLIHAGWVLVRADALIPRELDPSLPASVRVMARGLRLFAGPQARQGGPGARLARSLERLGPAAIKLGQVISTRSDIFGRAFADDLGRLKDRLAPFPTDVARAVVAATLERPVESLFVTFGDPVAAASLAQAHPATLADGRKVAVKVLRPGVDGQILRDIETIMLAASLVERHVPLSRRLEPVALAGTVAESLRLELDLRLEAAGASEMGEVMARDPYMRAPKVIWDGVGRRALTLDWAPGMALSDPTALEQPGLDRPQLATNLMRGFLAQAMDHGVFHADLHEGNLFVGPPAMITAVDFGIMGRLGPVARKHLAEILWGFLQRDYMRVAQAHFDAGYVPGHHSVEAFAQALRAVGEPSVGKPAHEISMGRLLGQLFEITAMFDMHLRPELVLLQKTMVTVEGVARRIDPKHDRWAAAEPITRRWITRELSPAAKVRGFADDAAKALRAMARYAEAPAPTVIVEEKKSPVASERLLWLALGAALAALAFAGTAFLR